MCAKESDAAINSDVKIYATLKMTEVDLKFKEDIKRMYVAKKIHTYYPNLNHGWWTVIKNDKVEVEVRTSNDLKQLKEDVYFKIDVTTSDESG